MTLTRSCVPAIYSRHIICSYSFSPLKISWVQASAHRSVAVGWSCQLSKRKSKLDLSNVYCGHQRCHTTIHQLIFVSWSQRLALWVGPTGCHGYLHESRVIHPLPRILGWRGSKLNCSTSSKLVQAFVELVMADLLFCHKRMKVQTGESPSFESCISVPKVSLCRAS